MFLDRTALLPPKPTKIHPSLSLSKSPLHNKALPPKPKPNKKNSPPVSFSLTKQPNKTNSETNQTKPNQNSSCAVQRAWAVRGRSGNSFAATWGTLNLPPRPRKRWMVARSDGLAWWKRCENPQNCEDSVPDGCLWLKETLVALVLSSAPQHGFISVFQPIQHSWPTNPTHPPKAFTLLLPTPPKRKTSKPTHSLLQTGSTG